MLAFRPLASSDLIVTERLIRETLPPPIRPWTKWELEQLLGKPTTRMSGAFDQSELVGFRLATLKSKPGGKKYLEGHALCLARNYQGRELGVHFSKFNRDSAIGEGIELIETAFDPLNHQVATFTFKVGCCVCRSFDSPRRLRNEWWLTKEPVEAFAVQLRVPDSHEHFKRVVEEFFRAGLAIVHYSEGMYHFAKAGVVPC